MKKIWFFIACLSAFCISISQNNVFLKPNANCALAVSEVGEAEKLYYGYNVTSGKSLMEQDALQTTFPIINPDSDYLNYVSKHDTGATQESKYFCSSSLTNVSKQFALNFGTGAFGKIYMVDFNAESDFDLSVTASNAYSTFYELYTTIIRNYYYVVNLDTEDIIEYLNPKFSSELNAVNSISDAKDLYSRYGTHLNTGYTYGGRLNITNYKSTSDTSIDFTQSTSLKAKVEATVGAIAVGGSTSFSEKYQTYEQTTQSKSTYNFVKYGGCAVSALTLDDLFVYNASITDVEKSGFMYSLWINSINRGESLSIIDIPNGAQSIPLWSLLKPSASNNRKRQYLMDAYMEICGDKYEEYQSKYKELTRAVNYSPDSEGAISNINSVYFRTPNGFFYNVPNKDIQSNGDHYLVHNGDYLYLDLERKTNIEYIEFDEVGSENVELIDKNNAIFKCTGSIGNMTIKATYGTGDKKENGILLSLPIKKSNFEGGSGAEEYPYIVTNKDQFSLISSEYDKSFILVDDIDFNGAAISPINEFSGNLDGNYCTLSNFIINKSETWGLISNNSGTISNLKIINAGSATNVSSFASNVLLSKNAGIVAGTNSGTIDNCYVENCFIKNAVEDTSTYFDGLKRTLSVGGIAGTNSGTISNSMVKNIRIENINKDPEKTNERIYETFSGGICGLLNGTISGCVTSLESTSYSIYSKNIASAKALNHSEEAYTYSCGLAGHSKNGSKIERSSSYAYATSMINVSYDYSAANNKFRNSWALRSMVTVRQKSGSITIDKVFTSFSSSDGNNVIPECAIYISDDIGNNASATSSEDAAKAYKRVTNGGSNKTIGNVTDFNAIELEKSCFYYDSSSTYKISHVMKQERKNYIIASLDSTSETMRTTYAEGEKFSPKNIYINRYINEEKCKAINVYKIDVFDIKGANAIDKILNDVGSGNYTVSISLYATEGANSIKVSNTVKLKVETSSLNRVYVDNPDDDMFVYYDEVDDYIDNFSFESLTLKGVLSNGQIVDINKSSSYISNAKLSLQTSIIEKGDNIMTITYGNSSNRFTATFILHCVEREVEEIEIVKNPLKMNYVSGQVFETNGMEVKLTFDTGETKILKDKDLNNLEIIGGLITEGENEVVIIYDNYTVSTSIVVTGYVNSSEGGDTSEDHSNSESFNESNSENTSVGNSSSSNSDGHDNNRSSKKGCNGVISATICTSFAFIVGTTLLISKKKKDE